MLWTALCDPDPVLIFEHGGLYDLAGELADDAGPTDIDRAAIRRPGDDVTLVTYGGSLGKALDAAEHLAGEGVSAEVIDLRTLRPLDTETIVGSVTRTHRAVVVDEGWRTGGLVGRGGGADRRGGLLRPRRADRAGVQRRGADPVRQAPRGGGAPPGRVDRRRGRTRCSEPEVGEFLHALARRRHGRGHDPRVARPARRRRAPRRHRGGRRHREVRHRGRGVRGRRRRRSSSSRSAGRCPSAPRSLASRRVLPPQPAAPAPRQRHQRPDVAPAPGADEAPAPAPPVPAAPEHVRASPRARRRAAERGVDLAGLRGPGPGGAVVAERRGPDGRGTPAPPRAAAATAPPPCARPSGS